MTSDLQGLIIERDQLLDIQKEAEARFREAEAENERLRAELHVARAAMLEVKRKQRQAEARLREVVEALKDARAILRNDPTPIGAASRRIDLALAALSAAWEEEA